MGNRLAKPPPLDRPMGPMRGGGNPQLQRPFPVLTPQSYLPGSGGNYPGYPPMTGPNNFPVITPNSYNRPQGGFEPPIMNYSGGLNMLPPALPPPMPYPNQGSMSMMGPQPGFYDPGPRRRSYRRPARICRRSRRSRRCRPVIRIIDSSSCSSLSSYTTLSSCSPRRHRSRSHSCRRASIPQQQQQPIILLPIQCQQPPTASAMPVQNQIQQLQQHQQQQPQQIILPPLHIQQSGQFDQQQLALPPMTMSQAGGQFRQQPITLPPMQFNSSNLVPNTSSNSMIISGGQQMIQPSLSLPQITNFAQPQQIQQGSIQYVQAAPQSSSSPLQYISAQPRSTVAPQRALVNGTNKKESAATKAVRRSTSVRDVPQNDLKFGRRPFDWYTDDKKNNIIDENIQVGQRRSTVVN